MISPKKKFLRFHHKSLSEKLTFIIYFVFFVTMALIFLYPIYSAFLISFSYNRDWLVFEPTSFWDFFKLHGDTQFESWSHVVEYFSIQTEVGDQNLLSMLFNSLWFTIAKVSLSLIASFILAYAVAKFNFPGKGLLYVIAVFVQTIPLFGTGSASYKLFDGLHMINNPTLFWVAWVTGFDFTFIILHGTLTGISNSYSESAKIDGANNLTIFIKIIIPMVAPVLLALFISNSLGVWNDYSTIMVYLKNYPTMSYGLYVFQSGESMYISETRAVQCAATIVSCMPIVILYSVSQKLILTNISVGGLKG